MEGGMRNKKVKREAGCMKSALAMAAVCALLLVSGCIGVPRQDYESLKASCEEDKKALYDALAEEKQKSFEASGKLSACTAEKQDALSQLAARQEENGRLKAEAALLAQARAKAEKMAQYASVLSAYNEAFGPGKIANTPKLSKIEAEVGKTGDSGLSALWSNVLGCGGITECSNAKAAFTASANASITSLALEIAGIVGNSTAG
jgi:hypothetical protein